MREGRAGAGAGWIAAHAPRIPRLGSLCGSFWVATLSDPEADAVFYYNVVTKKVSQSKPTA